LVDRLIKGYDDRILSVIQQELALDQAKMTGIVEKLIPFQLQIPIQIMALQDCVNLANYILKTTIRGQELTIGVRGCGGKGTRGCRGERTV